MYKSEFAAQPLVLQSASEKRREPVVKIGPTLTCVAVRPHDGEWSGNAMSINMALPGES